MLPRVDRGPSRCAAAGPLGCCVLAGPRLTLNRVFSVRTALNRCVDQPRPKIDAGASGPGAGAAPSGGPAAGRSRCSVPRLARSVYCRARLSGSSVSSAPAAVVPSCLYLQHAGTSLQVLWYAGHWAAVGAGEIAFELAIMSSIILSHSCRAVRLQPVPRHHSVQ